MPHKRSNLVAAMALLLVAAAAGCEKREEVTHYRVPKAEALQQKLFPDGPAPPAGRAGALAAQSTGSDRMVAAIIPRASQLWFFKLAGPSDAIADQSKQFAEFLMSIHFADAPGSAPEWTLPEGWKQQPGSDMRFATLKIDNTGKPLEVSIFKFPKPEGTDEDDAVLLNVNRWRGQMGLGPIGKDQLATETHSTEIPGGRMILVNLLGKQKAGGMSSAPFAGGAAAPGQSDAPFVHPPINEPAATEPPAKEPPAHHPAAEPPAEASPALSFDTPKGWKKGTTGTMRLAAFAVEDGSKKAEITVFVFGPGGDFLANVNRWRGQVNLPDTTAEDLAKEAKKIPVGGVQGDFVELVGPEQTILGVMATRGDQVWFVKLTGDPALAQREKANFESFVKSIKFSAQ